MGERGPEESDIQPYSIAVDEDRLQRLHRKLKLTDLPTELQSDTASEWSRGPPAAAIHELAQYWIHDFDWRKAEAKLNDSLPQYMTSISVDDHGDYDVHFVHQKSQNVDAIPVLFLHGWPGSFYEAAKILKPLTDGVNGEPSFHVVAPSLIDHGFSGGSRTADFHIDQHTELVHKLMLKLGYDHYVAQGGDTGYLICRLLARHYPTHCLAHHINMSVPNEPSRTNHPDIYQKWVTAGGFEGLSDSEKLQLSNTQNFLKEGSAYFAIHSTRPMASAYSMTDSPVGLLAWIYDKLHVWTDDYKWTSDEILTWVSIYYFSTAGPAASFNTYYSNHHRRPLTAFEQAVEYIDVPVGVSRFDKEILHMPKLWDLTLGPIVFQAEHFEGGHFAAVEKPELLVGDLRKMFGRGLVEKLFPRRG
ncbi:uncharacterized protein LTR77_000952 [Saxophila tyrrhenica]|uniref:Epoxide hydrolase N-terminal domain-containing protein n=1 Tax=Saxophila tyrrhenica TaxID=1690608 RepID=A0AAV9PSK7_9PEZI|nr:hypothetical protein LTR77_000952 [Saxophila tyrrhenica]